MNNEDVRRSTRRWVLGHYIIISIGVLLVTGFLTFVYATRGLEGVFRFRIGQVVFHFDSMLVILISSIVGFAPAMVSFLLLFIASIVIDIGRSYTVFVYLTAAVVSFFAVRKRWYSEEGISLYLLAPLLAFILGDIQMILAALAGGQGLSGITPINMFCFFLGEIPECTIAVMLSYLYLIKAPDKVRILTGTGRLYMPYIENPDMLSQIRSSKLSRLVMGLIVVEGLVLGIAASAFANALLPTIGDEAFSESDGNFIRDILEFNDGDEELSEEELQQFFDVNGVYIDAPNNANDIDQATDEGDSSDSNNRKHHRRRFVLNRAGVAFDIKLMMLLLNTTIPFIVLASLFAQRWIVFPIVRMSESINEFCDVPQEDKEAKLKKIRSLTIRNDDEIGDLYRALSQMATNIVHFVDQEIEKEKLSADLRIAQKTSENKSQFLSNVSHELRTPINAVLGLDEMILRESKESATIEYATDIQNAGKTLLSLVNDILDSSKLEEGKMELIPTEYELSSMINDLVNMIGVKAEDKGLELLVEVDENIPHVLFGDEIRIKQVILNILTNAVKYTEQGSVLLEIGFIKSRSADSIMLRARVKDTGIGIKEDDLKKLFSRFERIEEERNKNIEGTGLGMNIVRRLLKLMNSELHVESVYGEGSDFSFEIEQRVVRWEPIGDFGEAYKSFVDGRAEYEAKFVAPDAKLLVVDDTTMNLTVVKGLLKEIKAEIITAESGAEALEKVKEIKFDIIFMDQRMPKMDGVETFHEMQKLSEAGENLSAKTPVIMLTANAVSGSREQFLKEGFSDYLSKPIDPGKLEIMVRTYLPDEKVLDPAEYEVEEFAPDEDGGSSAEEESPVVEALKGLASIDYEAALVNCGSEELLLEVLKDFLEAIPKKSRDIRSCWEGKDYKNYTILVHALKSSSRLLGANELSEQAAFLEECGDAATEGDEASIGEIDEKTAPLLKLYRSYYDKLTPLVEGGGDEAPRPLIPQEELSEALSAIREFVDAFDFDSADGVMEMIKDYQMPKDFEEQFEKIKYALSAVDREELLKLI